MLPHSHATIWKSVRTETGLLQTINPLTKGGNLRSLAAKEHSLSIEMPSLPTFDPKIPIAAITDEFSPVLSEAIPIMKEIGMTAAELRVIDGKNVMDLSDDELKRAKDALDVAGLSVVSVASPLLKCVLPNGPALDERFQHDIFASKHTFE